MRTPEDLDELLTRLRDQEQELSQRRRQLHERLGIFPSESGATQEQEISKRRRDLQKQIDELEAERRTLGEVDPGDAAA